MVGRPLIDELAITWRPRQQHPSGPAAERLAHRDEFRPPALVGSEIPRQRVPQGGARLALVPEPVEEQLMQDHRIHGDELLALEAVDEKAGGGRVIEPGELLVNQVKAFDRPAIIVLVVADDQPLGHALDLGRIAGEGLHSVRHQRTSDHGRAVISSRSKRVTLSSSVHSPMRPSSMKVRSETVNSGLLSSDTANLSPSATRSSVCQ